MSCAYTKLCFSIRWRGVRLTVDIDSGEVTYTVRDGEGASITFQHAGEELTVTAGTPVTRPLAKRVPLMCR